MLRAAFSAVAATLALATPALADLTVGQIHHIDPASRTVVLGDKTVWIMPASIALETFAVGDRIILSYQTAGEDGLVSIDEVTLVMPTTPTATVPGA